MRGFFSLGISTWLGTNLAAKNAIRGIAHSKRKTTSMTSCGTFSAA
jgi:hypothetical protein